MTIGSVRLWVAVAFVAAAIGFSFDARPSSAAPAAPSPHTSLGLAGGAFLHLYALPLGLDPGAIVGNATFDQSGTRAIFLAAYPWSAAFGDPQRMDPMQAFLLDVSRRRLTQLTVDGLVSSVRWKGADSIDVRDGGDSVTYIVGPPRAAPSSAYRFSADQSVRGDLGVVSPDSSDRLTVYRRTDGRYVVREIGARRLRVNGVSIGGRFAILGENLAWIDALAGGFGTIDRAGASNSIPPRFDDAFGRQLVALHPLSSAVYQGSYRNGVAYFAFSHGLTRVVAATRDFVSYFYPPMPDDPAYSVGDGLGALDDGGLYLAWPENSQLTVRRGGRFVTLQMSFPAGYSDPKPLFSAALPLRTGDSVLWPPLQPDRNALDAAMMQWRVYPTGPDARDAWIASYLGRVYLGDTHATFVAAQPPVFPFAVLTRSDDGTLWGASPVPSGSRASIARPDIVGTRASIARPSSGAIATLWSSRDGFHWRVRYALDGSPGAIGSNESGLWVAVTKPTLGDSMICVAKLGDDANPVSYATGGSYDGEQIFFASLSSGLYLIWGATPGREQADQGALSAFRLDAPTLSTLDDSGLNAYARVRSGSGYSDDGGATLGDAAMLQDTATELGSAVGDSRPVLATNVSGAQHFSAIATIRSLSGEKIWEAEFGAQPSPLGIVIASAAGDEVVVTRSVWIAPLQGHGATERWQRDASGAWRLSETLRTWSL
jgi:hypothetical protein